MRKKLSFVVFSGPTAMYFTFRLDLSSTMKMCSLGCTSCRHRYLSRISLVTSSYRCLRSSSTSSSMPFSSVASSALFLMPWMISSQPFHSFSSMAISSRSSVSLWNFFTISKCSYFCSLGSCFSILHIIFEITSRTATKLNLLQGRILTNFGWSMFECSYLWIFWGLSGLYAQLWNAPIRTLLGSLFSQVDLSIFIFHSTPSFTSVAEGASSKTREQSRKYQFSLTTMELGISTLASVDSTFLVLILNLFLPVSRIQSSLSHLVSMPSVCTLSPPTRQIFSSCTKMVFSYRNFSYFSSKLCLVIIWISFFRITSFMFARDPQQKIKRMLVRSTELMIGEFESRQSLSSSRHKEIMSSSLGIKQFVITQLEVFSVFKDKLTMQSFTPSTKYSSGDQQRRNIFSLMVRSNPNRNSFLGSVLNSLTLQVSSIKLISSHSFALFPESILFSNTNLSLSPSENFSSIWDTLQLFRMTLNFPILLHSSGFSVVTTRRPFFESNTLCGQSRPPITYSSQEKILKNPVLSLPQPPLSFRQFSSFLVFSSICRMTQLILGLREDDKVLLTDLGMALMEKDLYFPLSFTSAMWTPELILLKSLSLSQMPPKMWKEVELTGQQVHPHLGITSMVASMGSQRTFSKRNSMNWYWNTLIIFQTRLGLYYRPSSLHLASSLRFHMRGQKRQRVRSLMQ